MSRRTLLVLAFLLSGMNRPARAAEATTLRTFDLVVYGATAGGVAHAICAATIGAVAQAPRPFGPISSNFSRRLYREFQSQVL